VDASNPEQRTVIGVPGPAVPRKRARWKRWLRLIIGWKFVILGVLGLFLPFLQGILFLAIGLAILAPESPWAQRQLDRLRRRYPQMSATFDRAMQRASDTISRLNNKSTG
jgi:hypothetical protein